MGFFGTYLFNGHRWTAHHPAEQPTIPEPWLLVDIHDSDIATITYRPPGPGSGVAYLGDTPRTYFENPDASAPTDAAREAAGLGAWWAHQHGRAGGTEREAKEADLAVYLAEDLDPADIDLDHDDDEDDEGLDDAEIFVEVKTARFLAALDLPVPDDLPR
ncbi:hypothetical protein O7630_05015 [Micromonospora sp. WMMD718]|uniref:hypothetical protein n=1 Tax=Micromonospora TaxID=1873 RepID=UPI00064BB6EF|nr:MULTISPECIES: hypothetical protein [unclassified Micromonospora]MDG4750289.1 hypothetical protein [Micromonospora sp. WMMD718]